MQKKLVVAMLCLLFALVPFAGCAGGGGPSQSLDELGYQYKDCLLYTSDAADE